MQVVREGCDYDGGVMGFFKDLPELRPSSACILTEPKPLEVCPSLKIAMWLRENH